LPLSVEVPSLIVTVEFLGASDFEPVQVPALAGLLQTVFPVSLSVTVTVPDPPDQLIVVVALPAVADWRLRELWAPLVKFTVVESLPE
jgi:hypothetical protein